MRKARGKEKWWAYYKSTLYYQLYFSDSYLNISLFTRAQWTHDPQITRLTLFAHSYDIYIFLCHRYCHKYHTFYILPARCPPYFRFSSWFFLHKTFEFLYSFWDPRFYTNSSPQHDNSYRDYSRRKL